MSFLNRFLGFLPILLASVATASTPPNVLLVLTDDHSFPHLGVYGDPNSDTPNLDRFAAEGLRFDRAYTTAPQCAPSRSSILSGRSPVAIGTSRFSAALPPDVVTFADLLKQAGYFTGAGGRSHHLDGGAITAAVNADHHLTNFSERLDYVQKDTKQHRTPPDQIFTDFLEAKGDQPFFFWLNFYDPHRPWTPDSRPDPDTIKVPADLPDLPSVREDLADFYGEINRADRFFGDVMQVLEARGLAENTLVIFMGDNGEAWFRGKGTLYDRGCHVPLLIRWPDHIKPGTSTDALISGEDLAPTVLSAVGLAADPAMTGKDFLPLLRGEPFTPRTAVFTERGAHGYSLPRGTIDFDLGRSITTQRYHLIYNVLWQLPYQSVDIEGYNQPVWQDLRRRYDEGTLAEPHASLLFAPQRSMFELYDLEADPYELNNLSGQADYADIERDLKERLDEWMILQDDFVPLSLSR